PPMIMYLRSPISLLIYLFVNATSTTEIYTLSLHDALPIYISLLNNRLSFTAEVYDKFSYDLIYSDFPVPPLTGSYYLTSAVNIGDRKSTRLNSSHVKISYAVFCLKKKKI